MPLTAIQQAARSRGLGGSDAAPALGLSPWKSPLELYLEKRQEIEQPDISEQPPILWGNLLEPVIGSEYTRRTGIGFTTPKVTYQHPKHEWMLANLDGLAEDRVVEIKTARSGEGWGEPGSDQIPEHYKLQVMHYLLVTGLDLADVAVLIAGSDFRIYTVPADRELQELLLDGEADFWSRVEKGAAPDIDLTHRPLEIVRRLFPGTNGEKVYADEPLNRWRAVYEEAVELRDRYAAAADSAKAHLLYSMGEAAELIFDGGIVLRRREQKRKEYTVPASTYVDSRFAKLKE